jgi:hypothetical protein
MHVTQVSSVLSSCQVNGGGVGLAGVASRPTASSPCTGKYSAEQQFCHVTSCKHAQHTIFSRVSGAQGPLQSLWMLQLAQEVPGDR